MAECPDLALELGVAGAPCQNWRGAPDLVNVANQTRNPVNVWWMVWEAVECWVLVTLSGRSSPTLIDLRSIRCLGKLMRRRKGEAEVQAKAQAEAGKKDPSIVARAT